MRLAAASPTFLFIIFLCWLAALKTATSFVSTFHNITEVACTVERIYHSSILELKWIGIIDGVSERTPAWAKGCKIIKDDEAKIRTLLSQYDEWRKFARIENPISGAWQNDGILSYFETRENCGGDSLTMLTPIEPLIGFLRHPAAHCLNTKHSSTSVLDKNYMFMSNREQIAPRLMRNNSVSRNYLFDLGASLYTSGYGGASQQWFVDVYRERGIEFDRILAWENSLHDPKVIFADYPKDVVGKVSYFNVQAPIDAEDRMSPIRLIKALVKPHDFLVFKIDIDNDPVELAIVNSFMDDANITDLIDEFYFEHHVTNNPLEFQGWGLLDKTNNITQSYALFKKLRAAGIRAHSWV